MFFCSIDYVETDDISENCLSQYPQVHTRADAEEANLFFLTSQFQVNRGILYDPEVFFHVFFPSFPSTQSIIKNIYDKSTLLTC